MLITAGRQNGVTLIETMIAVAIVGLLVMIAMPQFAAWQQNLQVRNQAESILNGVQLARAESVRRNRLVYLSLDGAAGTSADTGCDWRVLIFQPEAADPANGLVQCHSVAQTGTNTQVTNLTPAGSTQVTFNGMGWAVQNPDEKTPPLTQIDVVSTASIKDPTIRALRVLVGTGGTTRMCDPENINDGAGKDVAPPLPKGDPRRCTP